MEARPARHRIDLLDRNAVTKIGWSIGPAISLWLLDAYGFVANRDQTPETIQGMHRIMSLIPARITGLAAGAVMLYPIIAQDNAAKAG